MSECPPPDVHRFWPLSTMRSPSTTARVVRSVSADPVVRSEQIVAWGMAEWAASWPAAWSRQVGPRTCAGLGHGDADDGVAAADALDDGRLERLLRISQHDLHRPDGALKHGESHRRRDLGAGIALSPRWTLASGA